MKCHFISIPSSKIKNKEVLINDHFWMSIGPKKYKKKLFFCKIDEIRSLRLQFYIDYFLIKNYNVLDKHLI